MSRQGCWCLWWGWWSHLHPWPEHSLLEQAPLLLAKLFSLSSVLVLLPAALLECCAFLSKLLCWHSTTVIIVNTGALQVSSSMKTFQGSDNDSCLTLLSWLQLDYFHCVTRGRYVLFLCSWLTCLSQVDLLLVHLDLPASLCLYEQIQKVLTRLCAVLVKSNRADHSGASLPWAGSQLISTTIIKCWSLPDGQPLSHPWRGCWKHCVSGKPSSADDHVPTANAYLVPICFVMMCIALLL